MITSPVATDQSDPTGGTRGFDTELFLRDVQAVGRPFKYLEGRAVPYNTWASLGLFMEQHAPNSLKHSTSVGAGRALPLLLFHDAQSFPIGVSDSWSHSDDGLDGVWRLNDGPEAQRTAAAAERGELTGLSIGFQPIRSAWEFVDWDSWDPELGPDHMDRVTRQESRLVEVSVTPTPAFATAQVAEVRTASRESQLQLRTRHLGTRPHPEVDRWREIVNGLRSPQR
jgi:HK97 family phage prohead protease